MEAVEVGEAVEGLVAHGLDAGGVEEEAGDALPADESLDRGDGEIGTWD